MPRSADSRSETVHSHRPHRQNRRNARKASLRRTTLPLITSVVLKVVVPPAALFPLMPKNALSTTLLPQPVSWAAWANTTAIGNAPSGLHIASCWQRKFKKRLDVRWRSMRQRCQVEQRFERHASRINHAIWMLPLETSPLEGHDSGSSLRPVEPIFPQRSVRYDLRQVSVEAMLDDSDIDVRVRLAGTDGAS